MRTTVTAIAVVLACALAPASASANWAELGAGSPNPLNTSPAGEAEYPDIQVIGGVLYAAWKEWDGSGYGVHVARLSPSGTHWERVGGVLNEPTNILHFVEVTDIGGVPYVSWLGADSSSDIHVYVSRLASGTNPWEPVAPGTAETGCCSLIFAKAAAEIGGRMWVAWTEWEGNGTAVLHAARLNQAGTDFVVMGTGPINRDSSQPAGLPSVAEGPSGDAWLAWSEPNGSGVNTVHVARFDENGADWLDIAAGTINVDPGHDATQPSLAFVGRVPHLAWLEQGDLHVARLNETATNWQEIGGGANPIVAQPGKPIERPSLAAASGEPHVSWAEEDSSGVRKVRVARPAPGGGWEQLGRVVNHNPSASASMPRLISAGGIPFVTWIEDQGQSKQARVARLEPEFESLAAFPTDHGALLSADVKTYGLPYRVGFQYGDGFARETSTKTTSSEVETVFRLADGLSPSTSYDWRPFARAGIEEPLALAGIARPFTTLSPQPGSPGPQGAPGPQGEPGPQGSVRNDPAASLLVALLRDPLAGRAGSRLTVDYLATAGASVTLTVKRGRKTMATLTGSAHAGRNRLSWRPKRTGRYTLALTAIGDAGQKATDKGVVNVTRKR